MRKTLLRPGHYARLEPVEHLPERRVPQKDEPPECRVFLNELRLLPQSQVHPRTQSIRPVPAGRRRSVSAVPGHLFVPRPDQLLREAGTGGR